MQQVSSNMDRPLRLTSIRLAPPPPTTRSSFLSSLLSPFLNTNAHSHLPSFLYPTPPPPTNLHEILMSTKSVVGYLDRFGIWDMQRSGVRLEHKRGGDDDEVELVLGLRERGRLFLKAGTEVGGGEGGGVSPLLPLCFGAEALILRTECYWPYTKCFWWRRVHRGECFDRNKDQVCLPGMFPILISSRP